MENTCIGRNLRERCSFTGMVARYYSWWGALFWTTQLAVVGLGICVIADLIDEGDDQSMPDYIQLTATYGGKTQDMTLEKQSDFNVNFPMFELVTDEKGKSITKTVKITKTKVYAPYIEVNDRATFLVYREKDSDGTTYLSAEGLMADNGDMFKLRSKERDGKSVDFKVKNISFTSMREGLIDRVTESPSFTRDMKKLRSKRARKRLNRQANRNANFDIIAIADVANYKRFLGRSNEADPQKKQNEAFRMIQEHYISIFNDVTMIYAGITSLPFRINVLLNSIVVATSSRASIWTELTRESDPYMDTIDTQATLEEFIKWLDSTTSLPAYDYVILFSGYDLTRVMSGVRVKNALGLAAVGSVCMGGVASAIVEDSNRFAFWIAAHEFGHGLGANHDGENNNCSLNGEYVMAASQSNNFVRSFSTCSLTAFNSTINSLAVFNGSCLFTALPSNLSVVTLPPDTVKSAEEQCQQKNGPESKLCRNELSSLSELCTKMSCSLTVAPVCITVPPEMGTSCGNKRWCVKNRCVESDFAPEVDEKCIFGDVPSSDCEFGVLKWSGVCYEDTFYSDCCGTCAKLNQSVPGCEYGDRVRTCDKLQCSPQNTTYLKSCCHTCNYGTLTSKPATTSTSPTTTTSRKTTTRPTTTTSRNITTSRRTIHRRTTTSPKTTPSPNILGTSSASPQRNIPVPGDAVYWLLKFCLIVIPVLTRT